MITKEDVEKLAGLSRISMSEDEKISIARDIEGILKYVGKIKEVSSNLDESRLLDDGILINVMREDVVQNEGGEYTEKLVKSAPKHSGGHIKVKKVL